MGSFLNKDTVVSFALELQYVLLMVAVPEYDPRATWEIKTLSVVLVLEEAVELHLKREDMIFIHVIVPASQKKYLHTSVIRIERQ